MVRSVTFLIGVAVGAMPSPIFVVRGVVQGHEVIAMTASPHAVEVLDLGWLEFHDDEAQRNDSLLNFVRRYASTKRSSETENRGSVTARFLAESIALSQKDGCRDFTESQCVPVHAPR